LCSAAGLRCMQCPRFDRTLDAPRKAVLELGAPSTLDHHLQTCINCHTHQPHIVMIPAIIILSSSFLLLIHTFLTSHNYLIKASRRHSMTDRQPIQSNMSYYDFCINYFGERPRDVIKTQAETAKKCNLRMRDPAPGHRFEVTQPGLQPLSDHPRELSIPASNRRTQIDELNTRPPVQ